MKPGYFLTALFFLTVVHADIKSDFSLATGLELRKPAIFGIEEVFGYTLHFPVMTNKHPLLINNSLSLSFETAVTPISIQEKLSISLTPVAFFKLGGSVFGGYGWTLNDAYGTGIYDSTGKHYLHGIVSRIDLFALLQAETKDLLHNDKLNFQSVIMQRFSNFNFTEATDNQSWIYQDDYGQNLNGWKWDQIFFLGYEYPFTDKRKLTLGTMVQTSLNLTHYDDSPMRQNGWGSDFFQTEINPLIRFQVNKLVECAFLIKFTKVRVYKTDNDDLHFMTQQYDSWEFQYDRIQAQVKYTFGKRIY